MKVVTILCADVVRAALAQMKPRPSVEMYPGDWLRDPISGCSLAANGFWWRATMAMHDAKPYGHLVAANGRPLTEQQIVQRCGCKNVNELRKVVEEIESVGVPGRTGDADYQKIMDQSPIEMMGGLWKLDLSPLAIEHSDVIYSRRMVKDRILSVIRFFVSPKGQSLIPSLSGPLTTQTPEFDRDARARSAEDEDEVDSDFDFRPDSPSKIEEEPSSRATTELKKPTIGEAEFAQLWADYPVKDGRKLALRSFCGSVKTPADLDAIRAALRKYLHHLELNTWKRPKNGQTWFNNWRDWENWVEPATTGGNGSDDYRNGHRGPAKPRPVDFLGD